MRKDRDEAEKGVKVQGCGWRGWERTQMKMEQNERRTGIRLENVRKDRDKADEGVKDQR